MTIILADIGGTHARFARLGSNGPEDIKKFENSSYNKVADALAAYSNDKGKLYIATAACKDGDVWRFTNNKQWTIDKDELQQGGWDVKLIVRDFKASARGAVTLKDSALEIIQNGNALPDMPRAIIGPGTGLGLAYATPIKDGWHIQETYGGHMLASAATAEHWTLLNLMKRFRPDSIIVPEYMASGSGLADLYQCACLYNGKIPEDYSAADLLEQLDNNEVQQALRLFHEFLGLFAHNVVVSGNAFGGLYLDGGVMHHLMERGLFNAEQFLSHFILNPVSVVKNSLMQTPIWFVKEPYVALHGLAEMAQND